MTTVQRSPHRSPFADDRNPNLPSRTVPLLSTTSASPPMSHRADPMDTSADNTSTSSSSRVIHTNNDSPRGGHGNHHLATSNERDGHPNGIQAPPVGAAAAAQQPKAISAAFIHKLYRYRHASAPPPSERPANRLCSMLEDQSIQHLISWSSSNESFVMSPSTEFSKVLA